MLRISSKLIILLSLIQERNSDCGRPGISFSGTYINPIHGNRFSEKKSVEYGCKGESRPFNNYFRICEKGKWTGHVPKCALQLNSKLVIDRFEVQYLDQNSSIKTIPVNRTFIKSAPNCLTLNETTNMNFHVIYSPRHRISVVQLYFKDILKEHPNKIELNVNLSISPHRKCIVDKKVGDAWIESDSDPDQWNQWVFICEYKSYEDYLNETIIPQSLKFEFLSKTTFSLKICIIYVFKFFDDCGTPDIPLHASIRKFNRSVQYLPTPRVNRYHMIGDYITNCLFEENWDKNPPLFKPIIQCNIDEQDLNSNGYEIIEFKNFEFFNETEIAVVHSEIIFQCIYGENTSKTHRAYCNWNGSWVGDYDKCDTKIKNTFISGFNDQKDKIVSFPIIIVLFSALILALIISAIFIGIIWCRKKFRGKKIDVAKVETNIELNSELERYDDINNETYEDQYERIDYELNETNFREYDQINYDELNNQTNKPVEYTEILE